MKVSKNILISVFDKTTNSYKYYWWLSILKLIQKNEQRSLSFNEIAVEMLTTVWYPVIYYKISLGTLDKLSTQILNIQNHYDLPDEIDEKTLREFLLEKAAQNDKEIMNAIKAIMWYVPYRFIRPWFPESLKLRDAAVHDHILKYQDKIIQKAPYKIYAHERKIELDSDWFHWIKENIMLIESFTLYKLFEYVEKNNPNMPNVSLKLFKPRIRKLTTATKLWKSFIDKNPEEHLTVFEKKPLNSIDTLSIDHFLPWSYLTHDQLWNLHPMERSINSQKGNKIPATEYLDEFCNLQYNFVHFVASENLNLLSDYNSFFTISSSELLQMEMLKFSISFRSKMLTEYQFAINRGFNSNWICKL